MDATKRTVIIRSLWAFIFLLIALAPYLAVAFGWSQEAEFLSVFVTPLFLVASQIAGIGAIIAGSRITDRDQRRILVWALICFTSVLAALVILLGSFRIAATPFCTDPVTARVCMASMGVPAYFCMGVYAAVSILALLVTPVLTISDAARKGKWVWFSGILLYLLGSLAALGWVVDVVIVPLWPDMSNLSLEFVSRHWLQILPAVALLLLPVITLLYSFTGREQPKNK